MDGAEELLAERTRAAPVHQSRLSPLAFLDRSAAVFPERVAVVDGSRRLTFGELRARSLQLARALQDAGLERADRVAYLLPNVAELVEAHDGVPRAGAVLVAMNTRLTAGEIETILRHSGARLLVVHTSLAGLVAGAVA